MKLHTCIISYNRLQLTKQVIQSYLATISVPFTLVVVDNASESSTQEWLLTEYDYGLCLLGENRYPGFACNIGWGMAPADADFLHRADNDFKFLPGWCEQIKERFRRQKVGQVGLRTDEEEVFARWNVGGNCVIRRSLWDKGLRYDERPWYKFPPGYSEDSFLSPAVEELGYTWTRVKKPCIETLASGDWNDSYYQRSYGDRGIVPDPGDPSRPGTS